MNNFVVWMNSKNAHIFAMKSTGIEKEIIHKGDQDHHTRHKNDQYKDTHTEKYFKEIDHILKNADQMLLIGPGLAKKHFKEHLITYHANSLAKKIIGVEESESFEHESENQLMAKAHQFFKTYDLFNNPI